MSLVSQGMDKMTQHHQVTSAKSFRAQKSFILKVDDDLTVRVMRMDMAQLVVAGVLPLPMLKAAQEFEHVQDRMIDSNDPIGALSEVDIHARESFVQLLQAFACKAVIEPVIVPEDDGDENHLPVTFLTMAQLLKIWNTQEGVANPVIDRDDATEFRRSEPELPADDVPPGKDVRAEAEFVAVSDHEYIGQ